MSSVIENESFCELTRNPICSLLFNAIRYEFHSLGVQMTISYVKNSKCPFPVFHSIYLHFQMWKWYHWQQVPNALENVNVSKQVFKRSVFLISMSKMSSAGITIIVFLDLVGLDSSLSYYGRLLYYSFIGSDFGHLEPFRLLFHSKISNSE